MFGKGVEYCTRVSDVPIAFASWVSRSISFGIFSTRFDFDSLSPGDVTNEL